MHYNYAFTVFRMFFDEIEAMAYPTGPAVLRLGKCVSVVCMAYLVVVCPFLSPSVVHLYALCITAYDNDESGGGGGYMNSGVSRSGWWLRGG